MIALDLIKFGARELKQKRIVSSRLDSELLLSKILNKKREEILINLEQEICQKNLSRYKELITRCNAMLINFEMPHYVKNLASPCVGMGVNLLLTPYRLRNLLKHSCNLRTTHSFSEILSYRKRIHQVERLSVI